MNYYKAFNKDMTCRNFQYEIGKIYEIDGGLELCKNGFHFCDILNACYNYYPDNDDTIICLVEPLGDVVYSEYENKLATNKIKIVRQLSKEEIEQDRFLVQDGVKCISNYTFRDCKSLKRITIPDSVTYIGSYAFSYCESLKKISIPDSVTFIGDNAFSYCESLKKISIPDSVTTIDEYAFENCTSLTSINIPNSVTYIGSYAFCGCESLENITIPSSVTTISAVAFYDCKSLKEITIPDSVTSIDYSAFDRCTSLKSVTISNNATIISDYAFHGCTSLKEIIIPNGITSIGRFAFSDCELLTIYGYKNSYVEKYAQENNIKFEEINNKKLPKTRINYIDCDWINVKNKCRTTVNKKYTENNPSQTFRENLLISEHSPIRLINVDWSWENIPYWVSTEWSRHKFEKFISSQRNDRVNDTINRNFKPQNSPVNFDGYANAQNLIDSCRKRLCYCATKEARELAESLKYELFKCNCEVANVLVPNCIYRCGCPEINSCGFWNKFSKELNIETLTDVKNRYNVYNNYFYEKYEKKQ